MGAEVDYWLKAYIIDVPGEGKKQGKTHRIYQI